MILQSHPEHRFMALNRRWVSDGTVRRPLNRFHHSRLERIAVLTGAAALRVFSLGIGLLVRTQTTTIRPDVPPVE